MIRSTHSFDLPALPAGSMRQDGNSAPVIDFRQVRRMRAGSQNARFVAERGDRFKKSNILTLSGNTEIPAVFEPRENLRNDERVSRHLAHAASLPPETVTAWRNPVALLRSGISSPANPQVSSEGGSSSPRRIHSGAPAQISLKAPAVGLNSRSGSPSSTASVTSEPPYQWPTARVVDANAEPSCLKKSGRRLARSTVFHREATAKARTDASRYLGSVVGAAPGRRFFSEAEAERLALSPRLPHHRRPLTADEALAGIITATVCGAALLYTLVRWLA